MVFAFGCTAVMVGDSWGAADAKAGVALPQWSSGGRTMPATDRWITKTLRAGRRQSGQYVTVHQLPARERRLAVIVSRKVSGKAVMRNRTKRVIVQAAAPILKYAPLQQIVIVAKQSLPPGEVSQAARDELESLLH